jgi:hypothetical protein
MNRLIQFASSVLGILQRDTEWSSDTLGEVAGVAIDLGLAEADDNGLLRVKTEPDSLLLDETITADRALVVAANLLVLQLQTWVLKPVEEMPGDRNPWSPWSDSTYGFVVRARSEEEARKIAAENASYENDPKWGNPWLDPDYSTCRLADSYDSPGVILEDNRAA